MRALLPKTKRAIDALLSKRMDCAQTKMTMISGETYRNECELKNVICVRSRKMSAGDKLIYLDYKGFLHGA